MSLRKKILVVDDDIDVIGTVKAVLGKDYDIITAHDKVEGLERPVWKSPIW
jgi:CheY-like chemotaxis protein